MLVSLVPSSAPAMALEFNSSAYHYLKSQSLSSSSSHKSSPIIHLKFSSTNSFHTPLLTSPLPLSPLLRKPISTDFRASASNTISSKLNESSFLKACAKSFGFLVVGLFLSLGKFTSPALADVKIGGVSPSLVEKLSGQDEKIDKDDSIPSDEKLNSKDEKVDEDLYLELLKHKPKDVNALKMILYSRMSAGKTKEAVKYVERLIEVQPDEVEWRLVQALSYEMMGQLSKAKRLFKKILEESPLNLRALHGLALVMHKKNEGPAVFEMLNCALDLAQHEDRVTEERNIKILIAQMHVIKGELEEGLRKFQDLVEENPQDFRPYLCQGIIYSLLDMKEEAEEQFKNYQSLVPHEFPQRGFVDEVMMSARTQSKEDLEKEFAAAYKSRK